jgi:hypothetical protein
MHYTHIFNFTYPLRCLRVPPRVRVPQAEYHCSIGSNKIMFRVFKLFKKIIDVNISDALHTDNGDES